jgi:hypothetical protein
MFATIHVLNFICKPPAPSGTSPATALGLIDEKNNKPVIIQLNPVAVSAGEPGDDPSQALPDVSAWSSKRLGCAGKSTQKSCFILRLP